MSLDTRTDTALDMARVALQTAKSISADVAQFLPAPIGAPLATVSRDRRKHG